MAYRAVRNLLIFDKSNGTSLVVSPTYLVSQHRLMTTSKRVQDRSKMKRILDLEIATEKWKIVSKILFLIELLKQEPEQIMPIRSLSRYRRQINLPKPHNVSDFIRKSPKLFELYKDHDGVWWCGMTKEAEELVEEEERITEEYSKKAAEHVTRCLMMSVDKRLPLEKIAHFRRDFGLPIDFRKKWVCRYPQHFRVVKSEDDIEFLELVSWNPSWAITELEKKMIGVYEDHQPGLLSLSFPLKFPSNYKVYRYRGKIDHFQKGSYLSPYADAHEMTAGSLEFDKRAVAMMHELLSFTIEKRLIIDHLTHFWSKAYEGSELIEKCPLILWKEKVQTFIGYRGRKKKIDTHQDFAETKDEVFFQE